MRDPEWYPKDTYYNIYNKDDFTRNEDGRTLREHNHNWARNVNILWTEL